MNPKSIFFDAAVTLVFLGASAYLQFISDDEYAIVFSKLVTAPGGTLEVEVDTYVTSLTITPLEQAAARYGIELRLSGVATEIPRANKD